LSERSLGRGLFRPKALEQLLSENEGGHTDRSYHLWALIMLEQWYRAYIDS